MNTCLKLLSRRQRGLSLVELMVTVAILAMLITIAPGSLFSLVETGRQGSAQNEVTTLLSMARSRAISSNSRVTLCREGHVQQCAGDARAGSLRWQSVLAFVDLDQDRQVGAQETVFYVATFPEPVHIIWNRGDTLVYQPDGTVLGGSNGTFTISTTGSSYSRLVVVSMAGRIRTAVSGN